MGCGLVKVPKKTPIIKKNIEIDKGYVGNDNRLSLYTVKEEMSEMEQSRQPSNRQSVLLLADNQYRVSNSNELNV